MIIIKTVLDYHITLYILVLCTRGCVMSNNYDVKKEIRFFPCSDFQEVGAMLSKTSNCAAGLSWR